MTPKDKAKDLVEDMHDAPEMGYNEHAKQCALIAVDEIMNVIIGSYDYELEKIYWQEVKKEIEAL